MPPTHLALLILAGIFSAANGFAAATIPLLGKNLYPESIAYDRRSGAFYVSSNENGSVQRVHEGKSEVFQGPGTDGRTEGLGIKVDETRDRLWVSGVNALYVYRIKTNQLLAKIEMAAIVPGEKALLNDLAIDPLGNAYVTDSVNPIILKVDGATLAGSVFCKLPPQVVYGTLNGISYNLNGIVVSPDGKSLIAVKTNDGTLWRISLVTKLVSSIQLSEDLLRGDGLVWGEKESLYVIRNFNNKISRVDFAGRRDEELHHVVTVSPPEVSVPTSAVYLAQPRQLVVVNSQFGVAPTVVPFSLTRRPAF